MRNTLRIRIEAVALLTLAGCGGTDAPTQVGKVVQLADLQMNPRVVNCGGAFHVASPDSIEFRIEMVNTTSTDVTIAQIDASAVISTSTDPADIGKSVLNVQRLSYVPNPALVRARDGDVIITARLGMGPYCGTKPGQFGGSQDLVFNIRVKTPTGEYLSSPQVLRVIFDPD